MEIVAAEASMDCGEVIRPTSLTAVIGMGVVVLSSAVLLLPIIDPDRTMVGGLSSGVGDELRMTRDCDGTICDMGSKELVRKWCGCCDEAE